MKIKIGISCRNIDEIDTGEGRYSHSLYEGLRENGIKVDLLSAKLPELPLAEAVHSFLFQPVKVMKEVEKFDLIHAISPSMAVAFPFIQNTKKVVTIHDLIPLEELEFLNRPVGARNSLSKAYNYFTFNLEYLCSKCADHFIAVSSLTKKKLVERGFSRKNITVVPHYPDERFHPIEKRTSSRKILGYFGALTYRKRPQKAIEVINCLSEEWELWIYGNIYKKSFKQYFDRKIEKLGVEDKVVYKGPIADEELPDALNSFDVCFFPSKVEGFGLPILEVSSCGIPVIVMEDAEIPKEVKNLCLVAESPSDVAEKAEIIENSRIENPIEKPAIEKFNKERTMKKTIQAYKKVLTS